MDIAYQALLDWCSGQLLAHLLPAGIDLFPHHPLFLPGQTLEGGSALPSYPEAVGCRISSHRAKVVRAARTDPGLSGAATGP
jgi:hypothetical protein